jgi:hypothetical protein
MEELGFLSVETYTKFLLVFQQEKILFHIVKPVDCPDLATIGPETDKSGRFWARSSAVRGVVVGYL